MTFAFWLSIGVNVFVLAGIVWVFLSDDGEMPKDWKKDIVSIFQNLVGGMRTELDSTDIGIRNDVEEIKKNVGYWERQWIFPDSKSKYMESDISISDKLDALCNHLKLDIKREEKAERIVVSKKKKGK